MKSFIILILASTVLQAIAAGVCLYVGSEFSFISFLFGALGGTAYGYFECRASHQSTAAQE